MVSQIAWIIYFEKIEWYGLCCNVWWKTATRIGEIAFPSKDNPWRELPLSGYFSSLKILTKTTCECWMPVFHQLCCRSLLHFLEARKTIAYPAPSRPVGCFLGAAPPVPPSHARTVVTFPESSRMQGFPKTRRSCQFVGQIGYALEFMPYGTSTLHRILKANSLELAAEFWHACCYLNSSRQLKL